jgi:Acetyltransferase (GNAT) domain
MTEVLTPRLVLRPVGTHDVGDLVLLYDDPQVALWTGPWTRAAVVGWAQDMAARWTADGVGKWMARDRLDGSLVGRGGFTRFDLDGETVLELGWAVRDARTGRGYATELGRAALACRRAPTGPAVRRVHRGAQPCLAGGYGAARDAAGWHHPTCGPPRGPDGRAPGRPFALYRL